MQKNWFGSMKWSSSWWVTLILNLAISFSETLKLSARTCFRVSPAGFWHYQSCIWEEVPHKQRAWSKPSPKQMGYTKGKPVQEHKRQPHWPLNLVIIPSPQYLKTAPIPKWKFPTWLVLSTPLKNMKVSWDDEIPNIWKVIKTMFQTTSQLLNHII